LEEKRAVMQQIHENSAAHSIASNGAVIDLLNVTKVYGEGQAAVQALKGIDLYVPRKDFIAVMGHSGSGKSTCMNILGCLDTPTSGVYFFEGMDVSTLSRDQRTLLRRHYLGFIFQGFNLLQRTSALENVELPLIYRGMPVKMRREKAHEALAAVGLDGREHHAPSELSGGQQQRVAIARAIVSEPQVLLADEPTGNLDSARSNEIMELLVQLNRERGLTVIMVTHEAEMARFASRQVHFLDGRIERIQTI
jgi:putative ABC transport system ATP-binding protein